MELNEKETHCIARLLQGAFYKKFLKNSNENIKEYFRNIFADELN